MSTSRAMRSRESAWVVKARAGRNDLPNMLRAGTRGRWVTRRPPKSWLEGDLIFIWNAAPELAICGVAEMVGIEPADRVGGTHFWLRYLTSYLAEPVGIGQLRGDRVMKNASFLKSGPAGTAFSLTASQAERLTELVARANPRLALPGRRLQPRQETKGLALSVRQPWAELILQGVKVFEYRSFTTHKRGRVMLYASEGQGERERAAMKRLGPGALPTGVIVGSVEIVGSTRLKPGKHAWSLRRPVRLKRPVAPRRRAQPAFFRPFSAD
jgi:hypothetical protein